MKFEKTYSMRSGPPSMTWDDYEALILPKWQALLGSKASTEADFQAFFERHPCMIPGPFGLIGQSGHSPHPAAMISQPVLPDFTRRVPDFMWIACDSLSIYPVLIEIETPSKPWFRQDGAQHSSLTQAREQITEWKMWFSEPLNVARLTKYYDIRLDGRTIRPFYVLIYGRRSEANRTNELATRRANLARDDEILMTFDRLTPQAGADEFFTVKVDRDGYRALFVPPTATFGPMFAHQRARMRDKEEAIRNSPYFSVERRQFVLSRLDYWDDWSKGPQGIMSTGDYE